jgi:hypothetical protein
MSSLTGLRHAAKTATRSVASAELNTTSSVVELGVLTVLIVVGASWLGMNWRAADGTIVAAQHVQLPLAAAPPGTTSGSVSGGAKTAAAATTGGTSTGATTELGLSSSAAGAAVFSVSNLAPGGVRTGSITVTNTGKPASVQLVAQNVRHDGPPGSGDLSSALHLKVVDTTTASTLYDASLSGLATAVRVCGSTSSAGSCPQWANREAHTFTFTISLPRSVGNEFQATSVTADYVWSVS